MLQDTDGENPTGAYFYHGTLPDHLAAIRKTGLHSEMNYFDRRCKQAMKRGTQLLRVHQRHLPADAMFNEERTYAYTRGLIKPAFIEIQTHGAWLPLLKLKEAADSSKPPFSLMSLSQAFLGRKRV
jgi:hypothetical protein